MGGDEVRWKSSRGFQAYPSRSLRVKEAVVLKTLLAFSFIVMVVTILV